MGGSLVINVLVYTHSGGSALTSSIGLKPNIFYSSNNPSGGLAVENF